MWEDGFDISEEGKRVKLYKPAQDGGGGGGGGSSGKKSPPKNVQSYIGGYASGELPAPTCVCNQPMFLLLELNLEKCQKADGATLVDRKLQVFGCPRAECFGQLKFAEDGFASGGKGIMACRSTETPSAVKKIAALGSPVKSAWYSNSNGGSGGNGGADAEADNNEWGMDVDGNDDDDEDLERAVAAMEVNNADPTKPKATKPKPKPSNNGIHPSATTEENGDSFDYYALTAFDEPDAPMQQMEEDDVGVGAGGLSSISDEKVRNMLARYMAEEEDEMILAALKGTPEGAAASGNGGDFWEPDERLSLRDRVLLGFQDRINRNPRQVVRYAPGGVPMWSIPTEIPSPSNNSTSNRKNTTAQPIENGRLVPRCPGCGTERIFEVQLLPSVLHVLEVDQYSGESSSSDLSKPQSGINALLSTGMNWGSVAMYTCPACPLGTHEEHLVIQKSVDEMPDCAEDEEREMPSEATMAVMEDLDDDADFEPDS
jgi:pre-rRNA-processing protein TSR4